MLMQVLIAIASSLALVLALLLRTGMGRSGDFKGFEGHAPEPVAASEEAEPMFVPPAGHRAPAMRVAVPQASVANPSVRNPPMPPPVAAPAFAPAMPVAFHAAMASSPSRDAAGSDWPTEPARQRIRIGAVSLEVPEGQEVTVLQDNSGGLTVMIQPPLAEPAGQGTAYEPAVAHVPGSMRVAPDPRERTVMARALEIVAA